MLGREDRCGDQGKFVRKETERKKEERFIQGEKFFFYKVIYLENLP